METKRKRIDDDNAVPSLPLDLLEEILLRLPPQCLVKLKSVCKSWLELIASESFLQSYHSIWKHRYGKPCRLKRGRSEWHPSEERTLLAFIGLHGTGDWRRVSSESGLRCRSASDCYYRWSDVTRGLIDWSPITKEEGDKIVELHYRYNFDVAGGYPRDKYKLNGHRWDYIARHLPRTRSSLRVEDWLERNGRTVTNNSISRFRFRFFAFPIYAACLCKSRYGVCVVCRCVESFEPEVKILSLSIVSPGRPDIVLPVPENGAPNGLWFTLKEGSRYRLRFTFRVSNNIVSGLKYTNTVWKAGIRVDSSKEMLGTFSPQLETYTHVMHEEITPSGILARGSYSARSKFLDDDDKCYLEIKYSFNIQKDWASS